MDLLKVTKKDLELVVEKSLSKKDILKNFNRKGCSGDYRILNERLKRFNISCEHFTYRKSIRKLKYEDLFIENCPHSRNALRDMVLKKNLIEYKCAICGNIGLWNNKPLTLTLDHINGINNDNRIENLRFVCPNCDSQSDTYCSKNLKRNKIIKNKKVKRCNCGNIIKSHSSKITRCRECFEKERCKNIPSKQQIFEDFKNLGTFEAIGAKYNITGKGVVRWLKHYQLPYHKKDIKEYIEDFFKSKA